MPLSVDILPYRSGLAAGRGIVDGSKLGTVIRLGRAIGSFALLPLKVCDQIRVSLWHDATPIVVSDFADRHFPKPVALNNA